MPEAGTAALTGNCACRVMPPNVRCRGRCRARQGDVGADRCSPPGGHGRRDHRVEAPITCGYDRLRAVISRRWMALIVFRTVVARLHSHATIAIRRVLPIAEIARRLGRAEATVKAYLYDPSAVSIPPRSSGLRLWRCRPCSQSWLRAPSSDMNGTSRTCSIARCIAARSSANSSGVQETNTRSR